MPVQLLLKTFVHEFGEYFFLIFTIFASSFSEHYINFRLIKLLIVQVAVLLEILEEVNEFTLGEALAEICCKHLVDSVVCLVA